MSEMARRVNMKSRVSRVKSSRVKPNSDNSFVRLHTADFFFGRALPAMPPGDALVLRLAWQRMQRSNTVVVVPAAEEERDVMVVQYDNTKVDDKPEV